MTHPSNDPTATTGDSPHCVSCAYLLAHRVPAGYSRLPTPAYHGSVSSERQFLSIQHVHHVWDNSLPPAITVSPGETFAAALRDASDQQLRPGTSTSKLRSTDFGGFWPLTGPVTVRGAEPGDAVAIEIIDLQPGDWGWTAVVPERGLLRDEIHGPYLHHWQLRPDHPYADLRRGIRVPLAPAIGVVGCALGQAGTASPLPPRAVGGKLDLPQLTVGAQLVLPVQTPGALLSFGHGRAAQGGGEVCGFGIECDMLAVLRITLLPKRAPAEPYLLLPGRPQPAGARRSAVASGPDLLDACRRATRSMIGWLTAEHRISKDVAYVLCSVAADLRVAQVVNTPHWTVTMSLPLSVFGE